MRSLPQLSHEERMFVRDLHAGCDPYESYCRAFPKQIGTLSPAQLGGKCSGLRNQHRIKTWMEFLENATPEEMIEVTYLDNLAFGDADESMKAAKAYLDSQFAGKEVAEIFINTLKEIHAEIVIPCNGEVERVTL